MDPQAPPPGAVAGIDAQVKRRRWARGVLKRRSEAVAAGLASDPGVAVVCSRRRRGWISCTVEGCSFIAVERRTMREHLREHDAKRQTCPAKGCEFSTSDAVAMREHRKSHGFVCDAEGCGRVFLFHRNLLAHQKRQHVTLDMKTYVCDWPGCRYMSHHAGHLKRHRMKHTRERPFRCDVPGCSFSAAQQVTLDRHRESHTRRALAEGHGLRKCTIPGCDYVETKPFYLERHMVIQHQVYATSRRQKRKHRAQRRDLDLKRRTAKRRSCPAKGCGYASRSLKSLEQHCADEHPGEKLFRCGFPGCDYAGETHSSAQSHRRLHDLLKCDFPGCNFVAAGGNRASDMRSHWRCHTEKRFICKDPGCSYSTSRLHNLRRHAAVHETSRLHKCPEPWCDFSTHTAELLRVHLRKACPAKKAVKFCEAFMVRPCAPRDDDGFDSSG